MASATGLCWGPVGGAPTVETWNLVKGCKSRAEKLGKFMWLLRQFFSLPGHKLDGVYYEAPVNMRALMQIGATEETIALLRGAIGVLEATAAEAGVHRIEAVAVQDARQALTGRRTFAKGGEAKLAVLTAAKSMGVDCKTDHEADSYAVWWFAAAMHNPRLAHLSTPLFRKKGHA